MAELIKIKRLKADSLLEVVIAAVLVVVIFGVAMMVYSNVLHASRPVKKVRAAGLLRVLAYAAEQQKDTVATDTALEDVTVIRRILPTDNPNVLSLHFAAVGIEKDTLAVLNKMILKHEK